MDRQFIYPNAIPISLDLLKTNRNVLIGMGMLMQELFGTATLASGLGCTQTAPASMSVTVAPGRIYTLKNLDDTAYSSLALDQTHQIVKQGISLNAVALACPAPITAGQSINYLIEAQYQDQDTDQAVLLYYNDGNTPLTGPGGNLSAQPTRRAGIISIVAKAGVAAPTGTQTTPTADAGYTGLYVVTVAASAVTIVNANISLAAGAPFLTENLLQKISLTTASGVFASVFSGSFTGSLQGCTTVPTATIWWTKIAGVVHLTIGAMQGISNVDTCSIAGLPSVLKPAAQYHEVPLATMLDNTSPFIGASAQISAAGAIVLLKNGSSTGWTPSGTKGFFGVQDLCYNANI